MPALELHDYALSVRGCGRKCLWVDYDLVLKVRDDLLGRPQELVEPLQIR